MRAMNRIRDTLTGLMRPTRGDWVFALRTTLAGLVALFVAYALRLEHPHWAMMTVFIVAQPVAGMVLAKSFYRLIGTLAGAFAALVMVPLFGGNAWLFLAVLSLWIGICTWFASMLRNPEAYGAALAGYTAIIIGLPGFAEPHLLHDLALARCGEIVIGILCAGISSRLMLPQLASEAMGTRLAGCISDLATYARGAFSGADISTLRPVHRKLVTDIQALSEMRAYARLETPGRASRAHSVRRAIGHLLSAISAARMLRQHSLPDNEALQPIRDALKSLVDDLAAPGVLDDTAPFIARLDEIAAMAAMARSADGDDPVATASRLALVREFVHALKGALRGLDMLRHEPDRQKSLRRQPALVIHRDHDAARRNAIRAMVATALVAAFWLETQWSSAAGIVVIVAVVASLFAARPFPVKVAWGFFKGTLLALPFAFVVGQLLLPAFPGFFWFALFVVPILVPAALAMANPRLTGIATAFAINFLAFLSPHQSMSYDPAEFLASSGSILIGILLAIGVFLTVLPANPRRTAEGIVRAMREDLARLCLHERIAKRSAFESLAYDRISQLLPLLQGSGKEGEALIAGSVAAVTAGLSVLRLRISMLGSGLTAADKEEAGDFLRQVARGLLVKPADSSWAGTVADARQTAGRIAASGKGEALQAAASMRVIAAAIEDHPAFFSRRA